MLYNAGAASRQGDCGLYRGASAQSPPGRRLRFARKCLPPAATIREGRQGLHRGHSARIRSWPAPTLNRGLVYIRTKEFDKAIADYSQVIDLQPDDANAYAGRGMAYLGSRQWSRAITDYTKAIGLSPQDPNYYIMRATAYEMKGADGLSGEGPGEGKESAEVVARGPRIGAGLRDQWAPEGSGGGPGSRARPAGRKWQGRPPAACGTRPPPARGTRSTRAAAGDGRQREQQQVDLARSPQHQQQCAAQQRAGGRGDRIGQVEDGKCADSFLRGMVSKNSNSTARSLAPQTTPENTCTPIR